jgi:hypothetical protein
MDSFFLAASKSLSVRLVSSSLPCTSFSWCCSCLATFSAAAYNCRAILCVRNCLNFTWICISKTRLANNHRHSFNTIYTCLNKPYGHYWGIYFPP